jgi:hypothetical protein
LWLAGIAGVSELGSTAGRWTELLWASGSGQEVAVRARLSLRAEGATAMLGTDCESQCSRWGSSQVMGEFGDKWTGSPEGLGIGWGRRLEDTT